MPHAVGEYKVQLLPRKSKKKKKTKREEEKILMYSLQMRFCIYTQVEGMRSTAISLFDSIIRIQICGIVLNIERFIMLMDDSHRPTLSRRHPSPPFPKIPRCPYP